MVWDTNRKTWNKPDRETNVNSKVKIEEGDILDLGRTSSEPPKQK